MRFASELLGQGKEGIDSIKFCLKIGKLDPEVIPDLEEAQILDKTGWTPKELAEQDAEKIHRLNIIWSASKSPSRREKTEMNGIG